MNYKMPKIFSARSRNVADMSVLKHAGTQMIQNRTDWQSANLVGQSSYGHSQTPHTERYGVTPFLTKSEEVKNSLMDINVNLQNKGTHTTGAAPHFFNQVKDAEEYVASLNHKPATMMDRDFPYLKQFAGRDIQYDVDFFIRQANNFDVNYK